MKKRLDLSMTVMGIPAGYDSSGGEGTPAVVTGGGCG